MSIAITWSHAGMDWLGRPLDPEAFDAKEATTRMRRSRTRRA